MSFRGSPPPSKRARSRSPNAHDALETGVVNLEVKPREPDPSSNRSLKKKKKAYDHYIRGLRRDYEKAVAKGGRESIEYDIEEMIGVDTVKKIVEQGTEFRTKFELNSEVEVVIERLSASGVGLAKSAKNDWIIAVPATLPGERVIAKIVRNERIWSRAQLSSVVETTSPSLRRDDLVRCKHFGSCGGCQYQMLPYQEQLLIKQGLVERAFKLFSGLDASLVPAVLPTIPSPEQYNYRTKITPHFQVPRELRRKRFSKYGRELKFEPLSEPVDVPIGFDRAGTKDLIDIEECAIATNAINKALTSERERVKRNFHSFRKGATLLLRDSLKTFEETDTEVVTNNNATVKECVGTTKFESPAGAFFQNNRSILPSLLEYIREHIATNQTQEGSDDERYLVDAYCGSGLFSLCLASLFKEVSGVEISDSSIRCASENAVLNGITNTRFVSGRAEEIFIQISYPPEKTTVIIDPPRRGCNKDFIEQLVKLGPSNIIYVSCNVHTQARDVGQLLTKAPEYEILSIRGADFFPQTHHVEGVCILRKKTMTA